MVQVAHRRSVISLFSDAVCPFSHAVRLVLCEKGITVDIQNVEGNDRPEDLADLNPYDSILTLVDRDLVLYESQIIMEYLDERFPHPPLMPVDPVSRANNRQLRDRIYRDLYKTIEGISSRAEAKVERSRKAVSDNLTAIAPAFKKLRFFMSEELTLADCYLLPLLWRLPSYGIELPKQAKPLLVYANTMFERPSFQESLTEQEREMRS